MSEAFKQRVSDARLTELTRGALPGSRKVYVAGTLHPFLRVPMREITQTATRLHEARMESLPNPPCVVYDSSGPYADPEVSIDPRRGLAAIRGEWTRHAATWKSFRTLAPSMGERARLTAGWTSSDSPAEQSRGARKQAAM